jgi:hypothetical protein
MMYWTLALVCAAVVIGEIIYHRFFEKK